MRTCACGCGRDLRRARADAIYATGGCRQRAYKGRKRASDVVAVGPVPQYEPDVVAFVAAGELDFLGALDWLTDPAGARDRYFEAAVA